MKTLSNIIHSLKIKLNNNKPINSVDIVLFTRQLATLMTAGVPIIRSLEILESSQNKIKLILIIQHLKRDILSGKNLFQSLNIYPTYFDNLTCQLIHIGEATGKLNEMLITVAKLQEEKLMFKKRIKQVLFYPSIITIVSILITLSMFLFVIPKFAELFQNMQDKLPVVTLSIFYIATTLQNNLWLFAILFSVAICSVVTINHFNLKKIKIDKIIYSLPFIKIFIQKLVLARFVRNLSITLSAGFSIIDSLKLMSKLNLNKEFLIVVAQLRSKISAGMHLHQAMDSTHHFPLMMIQMIKIGEESGMLEQMLDKSADFMEKEIEQLITRFSDLLEPLIMIVLGALIGGLVISMYLPIFKLGNTL